MLSPRALLSAAGNAAVRAAAKEISSPFKTYVEIPEAAAATTGTCHTAQDFLDMLDTFTISIRQKTRRHPEYKQLDFKALEQEASSCEVKCERKLELLKSMLTLLRKAEVRKREEAPFVLANVEATRDAAKKMIGVIDELWDRLMEIERQWKEQNDW